jgi:D-alanyl-D-alanine dipeptidase
MVQINISKIISFSCLIVILALSTLCADLVEVVKINPHIRLDIRYATTNNFAKKVVYPSARCFLEEPAAKALDAVQQKLEKFGLGLKIFDGYRPLSVQKIFWNVVSDQFPDETVRAQYVANPVTGSRHNRGSAVDLTLIDLKTGEELVMPSGYDDFSEKAHRNYNAMSPEAKKNCRLLETIMKSHGFEPLPSEWWHFDWRDWKSFPIQDVTFEELEKKLD